MQKVTRLVPHVPPLDVLAMATILFVMNAPAAVVDLWERPSLLIVRAVVALLTLYGMLAIGWARTSVWMWGAIGLNLCFGFLTFWGLGFGQLLGALLLIPYCAASARRFGIPAITWWGVVAETVGFCTIPLIFFTVSLV